MGVMEQRGASDATGLVLLIGTKPRGVELFSPIWAPGRMSEPVAQPTWFLIFDKLNNTTGKASNLLA